MYSCKFVPRFLQFFRKESIFPSITQFTAMKLKFRLKLLRTSLSSTQHSPPSTPTNLSTYLNLPTTKFNFISPQILSNAVRTVPKKRTPVRSRTIQHKKINTTCVQSYKTPPFHWKRLIKQGNISLASRNKRENGLSMARAFRETLSSHAKSRCARSPRQRAV